MSIEYDMEYHISPQNFVYDKLQFTHSSPTKVFLLYVFKLLIGRKNINIFRIKVLKLLKYSPITENFAILHFIALNTT